MGLTQLRVTHKPKYSISVCPKNYLSILHLSLFSFSLISLNSNFFTFSVQSPFAKIKMLYMYTWMNSKP